MQRRDPGPQRPTDTFGESADEYLQRHGLNQLVKDCWRSIVVSRTASPRAALAHYFGTVYDGTNIVGREFEYSFCTRRNRTALLRQLYRSLWDIFCDREMTTKDFCFLVQFICPDFPLQLLQDLFAVSRDGNFDTDTTSNDEESERTSTYPFRLLLRMVSLYFLFPPMVESWLLADEKFQQFFGLLTSPDCRIVHFDFCNGCEKSHELRCKHKNLLCRFRSFIIESNFALPKHTVDQANTMNLPTSEKSDHVANTSKKHTFQSLLQQFVLSKHFEGYVLREISASHEQTQVATRSGGPQLPIGSRRKVVDTRTVINDDDTSKRSTENMEENRARSNSNSTGMANRSSETPKGFRGKFRRALNFDAAAKVPSGQSGGRRR